jgi:hypothetical protein
MSSLEYLEVGHEHVFHRLLGFPGIGNHRFQISFGNDAVGDQVIKLGGPSFLSGFLVVEKGDPEHLGDFLDRGVIFGGERRPDFLLISWMTPRRYLL